MKKVLTTIIAITIIIGACKKNDSAPPVVPKLTTSAVTNISFNSATTGGVITDNGGSAITASGICWSKTNNTPNLTDSVKSGTTASGSFTFTLNNLSENTTYYVRAFATNSAGTGYGNVVTFNTTVDTTKVTFTYNGATVTYGVIISPTTGRKWMDRNLGASQAATAYNDYHAYGDLFQWGRPVDGHQLINYTSSTVGAAVNGMTATLATSDSPGNNLFITPNTTAPDGNGVWHYDWRDNQNNNRWATNKQGPCPSGWHVPTTNEWQAETGITNMTTAYSQLKLTTAGRRFGEIDGQGLEGTLLRIGERGFYWSSTPTTIDAGEAYSATFYYSPATVNLSDYSGRSYGFSVRCIKD
jgi:uncharacterized protein (TIGR02145 family)